jgi:O-antigen ligase
VSAISNIPDGANPGTPLLAEPIRVRSAGQRLHVFLALSWMVLWLTEIFEHLDRVVPIPLYYPFVAIYVMYFVTTRPVQIGRLIIRPLFILWALTIVVPILLYFTGDHNGFSYVSMRVRIVCFSVVAGTGMMLLDPGSVSIVRRAALIALAIGIPINLAELVVPNLISISEGRSAGFYENPNNSAAALIICMILAVDFTKHTRLGFLIITSGAMAVLATFSRAGILFMALLALAYIILPRGRDSLSGVQRMAIFAVGAFGLAVVIAILLNFVNLSPGAKGRLVSVISADFSDASSAERLDATRYAFDQFLHYFWNGRGLGAPEMYDLRTHNSFVHIGVEYGVGGLILYLVILFAGLLKVAQYGWNRAINLTLLAGFLFYDSAFDHYVHVKSPFAVAFSVIMVDALIEDRDKAPTTGGGAQAGMTSA